MSLVSAVIPSTSQGKPVALSDTAENIVHALYLQNVGTADGIVVVRQRRSGNGVHASRNLFTSAGAGFTNQPANDGLEFVSSDAGDTTQTITVVGTTTGTNTLVSESKVLNGATQVATTKTDWGVIVGVELSAACAGTVTVREASGNQTITTLAPGATSKGVLVLDPVGADDIVPTIFADAASTKQIGIQGTNTAGATIYDSIALAGATRTNLNSTFRTVTKLYFGDLESARTVTLLVGSFCEIYLVQGGVIECGRSWVGANSTGATSGVALTAFY